MPGDKSTTPRYEAMIQLLKTADALWNTSRVFFAKWDLSPSQFNILNLLQGSEEGFTQIELSRLLIMNRSNVTGLIDRLEKRKLVKRTSKSDDRRAHVIRLTPSGRKLSQTILPAYHEAAEQVWSGIPVKRIPLLVQDLETLQTQIEDFSK